MKHGLLCKWFNSLHIDQCDVQEHKGREVKTDIYTVRNYYVCGLYSHDYEILRATGIYTVKNTWALKAQI